MTPALAAAAVTSSSRTEPPGCTIAVDPGRGQRLEPVGEREERVGGRDRAADPVAAALDGQPGGVDPVDLTHADADGGAVGGDHDRVGLDRAAGPPGEVQVGQGRRVGR